MFDWLLDILQETGATLRLPVSFVVIEVIGTFAFAISGVRLSSAKQFDIFGAWIVGMATAIGGGTLRDLLLDVPPFWMANSSYCICCALAVVWVMVFGKYLIRQDNTWFLFDTIGLALFNVIGIEKTLALGLPAWTAVAMGCITGAAGGVIRDVLINEVPLIFRKEIYALACVAGGLVYVGCLRMGMSVEVAALLSSGTVILMRMLAVHYHWQLPILKGERCVALCLLIPALTAGAQTQRIYDENVRTLQVTVEGNPTLPPLLDRRKHQHVELSWDEMSHDYQRYVYHIQHCDAEWNVSDGIFESDYLSGLNDQLIEDYEHSFNTTQIYTHYSLRLPNPQVSMLLSGNYRVQIFHEGDDMQEDTPVLYLRECRKHRDTGERQHGHGLQSCPPAGHALRGLWQPARRRSGTRTEDRRHAEPSVGESSVRAGAQYPQDERHRVHAQREPYLPGRERVSPFRDTGCPSNSDGCGSHGVVRAFLSRHALPRGAAT